MDKIEKYILAGFLVVIPSQLGKHWWPEWSLVGGIRVDYLSPTLYLVDIIWLAWVLIITLRNKSQETNKIQDLNNKIQMKKIGWCLTGLGLILLNIWATENRWAAGYGWLRIIQWAVTVKMIYDSRFLVRRAGQIHDLWRWIGPVWVAVETGLGWMQVVSGHSLGGIFYWLGERKMDTGTIGAAVWSVAGQERLRAYGTFSHPNSLAGFLGVVWLLNWQRKERDWSWWLITVIGGLGIGLTGGRTVMAVIAAGWLVSAGGKLIKIKNNKIKLLGIILGLMAVTGGILWGVKNLGGWDKEGVIKRQQLSKAAIEMIIANPLFGVGVNIFLVELPAYGSEGRLWLQPVHNIILLTVSEIGLVGTGLIAWCFWRMRYKIYDLRFKNKTILLIIGYILATGMVDHYWVTLPQNRWLLAVVLGIIF